MADVVGNRWWRLRRVAVAVCGAVWLAALPLGGAGCLTRPASLTQLVEARRLTADLRSALARAVDASNRAVMAEDDEAAGVAATETASAIALVDEQVQALRTILASLGYENDLSELDGFASRFANYRQLNEEVLALVVERSNLKAQRLSFGAAAEAGDAFRAALDEVEAGMPAAQSCCARAQALGAYAATLEIRALQAWHIAEASDEEMNALEVRMAASADASRAAVAALGRTMPPESRGRLKAASEALDRFLAINAEITVLSRRNTNVRALALSLGRKRTLAAECEQQLQVFEQALGRHEFTATR